MSVSNLQRLPVEITGIEFADGNKIFLKEPFFIKGRKPQSSVENIIIKFDCLFKEECKKAMIDKQKVLFKVLGKKKTKKTNISMYYFKSE